MPMRVALIKTGALGDVVRTTALLPGLRRREPRLELTWITASSAIELVRDHPDVARAVAIDEPPAAAWRHERYDWVLCLDDGVPECRLASSLAAGRLSGGYEAVDGARRYTDDVAPWFGMGLLRPRDMGGLEQANALKQRNVENFGTIFHRALGLPGPVARPFVALEPRRMARARSWLEEAGLSRLSPLIGLNTGAGGRWRFKRWGEEQTVDLARRLVDEFHAGVVVFGGPAERTRNQRITAGAGRPDVVAAPTDLALLDFTALIDQCDLLVTSDSLALHLGVARARPVVAFFGPTSAAEIDLYGRGEKLVTRLECRCCYKSDCPIRPHCMQSISSQDMVDAIRRSLTGPPRSELDSSSRAEVEPALLMVSPQPI
jgi:heptosyltransferase-2